MGEKSMLLRKGKNKPRKKIETKGTLTDDFGQLFFKAILRIEYP